MSDSNIKMIKLNTKLIPKDPSLKRYFKYMLSNRNMSVQFTSDKILQIMKNDLNFELDTSKTSYTKICIEAFAYYMQSWPDWDSAIKASYSDKLYESLILYLKNRLMNLRNREIMYSRMDKEKFVINVPDMKEAVLRNCDATSPYILKIQIPEDMQYASLNFKSINNTDIVLEFKQMEPTSLDFGTCDIMNHPFVLVEFKIPGLIHIQRSNPFKVERFIHTSDTLPVTEQEFIASIEEKTHNSKPKVYTYNLLKEFFKTLNKILYNIYSHKVLLPRRKEIMFFCKEFLLDIQESNVGEQTVCEGFTINYNMGQSSYFVNKVIQMDTENREDKTDSNNRGITNHLIYKTIYSPIVSYCLEFCTLLQQDITMTTFKYFHFIKDEDESVEKQFLHYINYCMYYKCIICESYYDITELKSHLNEYHPLDAEMKCRKCFKKIEVESLLSNRWKHECSAANNVN